MQGLAIKYSTKTDHKKSKKSKIHKNGQLNLDRNSNNKFRG